MTHPIRKGKKRPFLSIPDFLLNKKEIALQCYIPIVCSVLPYTSKDNKIISLKLFFTLFTSVKASVSFAFNDKTQLFDLFLFVKHHDTTSTQSICSIAPDKYFEILCLQHRNNFYVSILYNEDENTRSFATMLPVCAIFLDYFNLSKPAPANVAVITKFLYSK